ncbi:MAG: glycosyltransferase [Planctomycetes bacterium]|nr:glycosyltransferase [Planctomycetota bacterium]
MGEVRVLRVLRVITRLNVGGPARQALALSRLLNRDGFRTVLTVGSCPVGEGDLWAEADAPGLRIASLPSLGREVRPRDDARTLAALVGLMRRERPHVVHTHMAKAGGLGRVAARLAGVPAVVHTYHGHVFRGYFGPRATRAILAAERSLARLTDALVVLSPSQREEVAVRYRVAGRGRVRVLAPGLDLPAPAAPGAFRARLGLGEGVPLAGIVARVAPVKRQRELVLAWRAVEGAHLAVVGDGPGRGGLEALARDLGLDGRVHFPGFVEAMGPVYADLDLVVSCSAAEGTPLALIEARAAGVPAVAMDVGGVREVCPGATLVPAGAWSELARAVAASLASAGPEARRARRPDEEVRRAYGAERNAADHAALYREILGRRPGQPVRRPGG